MIRDEAKSVVVDHPVGDREQSLSRGDMQGRLLGADDANLVRDRPRCDLVAEPEALDLGTAPEFMKARLVAEDRATELRRDLGGVAQVMAVRQDDPLRLGALAKHLEAAVGRKKGVDRGR